MSLSPAGKTPSRQSLLALDYLNFFLANVQAGVGPFLATYLTVRHNWNTAHIGVALSIMGVATLLAQTPAGALVDACKAKRLLLIMATLTMGVSCLAITFFPHSIMLIDAAQALNGVAAAVFPPAIAAITLGMVGQANLAARTGRNMVFNHAGKIVAAAFMGMVGHFWGHEWFFYLVALAGGAGIVATLCLRNADIDYLQARAARPTAIPEQVVMSRLSTVLADRHILVFTTVVLLFHFANAAMLPLAGQFITRNDNSLASLGMAACVIAAQLVMVPVAALSGKTADQWGRRPLFLLGFAALTLRGVLYTLSSNPFFIVFVQLLDGIGQGIFGVVSVLVVADLTQGTGRYNLVLGTIGTAKSIGAALSNLVAGYIVHVQGFNAGFLILAAIAAAGFLDYYFFMPETKDFRASPSQVG